jgi:hypothetical protein
LSPENRSSTLDTSSMCEVHEPERLDWKVASDTTKAEASAVRFGMSDG